MRAATVYLRLRAADKPYVGCTTDVEVRERQHRNALDDPTVVLVPLATYSTVAAGFGAEPIVYDSLIALGVELENERRPNGVPSSWLNFTPEQRSENGRRAGAASIAAMTPAQRSERGRKMSAAITHERRVAASRKGAASMTPEQRSERSRNAGRASAAFLTTRRITCPICGFVTTAGPLGRHRKAKHAA